MRRAGRTALFLFAVMLPVAVASCADDLSVEPDSASLDRVPVLSASAASTTLNQADFASTAVTFTWSPGSNHGTSSAIDYTLQFDGQGGSFASPVEVALGRGINSESYTVGALNDLLTDSLKLTPGTAATLEVRVKAVVADSGVAPEYSDAVQLEATPYQPVSSTLYLIGDAAPNGWDANNATPLEPDENVPFIFTYEGNLAPGNFKFITTLGQFLPSYNRGATDSTLVLRSEDAQPDSQFTIADPGPYAITVNLVALTISIAKMPGPPFSQLWVIGDATPTGWSFDTAPAMRQDTADPFIFDYNEVLAAGEFKIATAKDFNAPFYRPVVNDPDLSSTDVQLSAGDPDNKWAITVPGPYKIELNLRDTTISIKPFTPYAQLWMVGDATPVGWDIDSPQPMTPDPTNPYVFTYTGPLSAGEFKFPVATGDWGGDFFMPPVNHPPVTDTVMRFVPGGQPDNKWQITEAGNYKITVNQLYETIRIEKQ